ncbi:MAG: M48 family metalloprotease [Alphaproteobacteria bacterium]|nr:M48 family metalloprotease [Alphaproteobacteria bacterium]MCB9929352.1 M48 family metalloprotease [Alphaproteobacteria bacterium]
MGIHLVRNDQLNAFVAGGLHIFIYTGLLQRSETPEQVIGVLAHEIGHIQGGHLTRFRGELENASAQSILFTLIGIAAAVATGDARVGAAVGAFGQNTAVKNLLQYSRTQESAADQAALRLLDATGETSLGLEQFLSVLGDQELLLPEHQDPYLRTHPLSRERIEALQDHLAHSRFTNVKASPADYERHARMKAKLDGFLKPVGQVLRDYPESDTGTPALIARAVAYHRDNRPDDADRTMAVLLKRLPDDPYIEELEGQIQFERGNNAAALRSYSRAVTMAPNEPLIAIAYAQALVVAPDRQSLEKAVKLLEKAVQREPDDGSAWRTLGVAYGRLDRLGEAALALAESEVRFGRADLAAQQAHRAQNLLKKGSPAWLRADDIRLAAERALEKAKNR